MTTPTPDRIAEIRRRHAGVVHQRLQADSYSCDGCTLLAAFDAALEQRDHWHTEYERVTPQLAAERARAEQLQQKNDRQAETIRLADTRAERAEQRVKDAQIAFEEEKAARQRAEQERDAAREALHEMWTNCMRSPKCSDKARALLGQEKGEGR